MSEHFSANEFSDSRPFGSPGQSSHEKKPAAPSKSEFTGSSVPLQVRLPQDLVQSLRLLSIQQNRSMSEIVLDCLTSGEVIAKAWVTTRKAG